MKLTIDKNAIVNKFLSPISRITEECSIHITPENLYALVNDLSGNIILYTELTTKTNLTDNFVLNVKDVRKLSRVFECVQHAVLELEVDDNASVMKYKTPELSFKLHLVNENVIRKCQLSLEKLNKMRHDTTFELKGEQLNEILKGSMFATETNKIYFFTKDDTVYAELTDKATQDIDSVTFIVTSEIEGEMIATPLPFSLEVLRLLSGQKPDSITVKINNTYKLIEFLITTDVSKTRYIIPAFVK